MTIESTRSAGADAPTAMIHLMEIPTARIVASIPIVMHEDPKELAIIDGHILVSSDSVTLAIPAPAGKP